MPKPYKITSAPQRVDEKPMSQMQKTSVFLKACLLARRRARRSEAAGNHPRRSAVSRVARLAQGRRKERCKAWPGEPELDTSKPEEILRVCKLAATLRGRRLTCFFFRFIVMKRRRLDCSVFNFK